MPLPHSAPDIIPALPLAEAYLPHEQRWDTVAALLAEMTWQLMEQEDKRNNLLQPTEVAAGDL